MLCFICKKCGGVTQFTESTLNKCLSVLAYRKKKIFKYGDLSLNRENSENLGYHYQCYRKFSVLKRNHQDELEALSSSNASSSTSASTEKLDPAQRDENARDITGNSSPQVDEDNPPARANDVAPGKIVEDANPKPSMSKPAPGDLTNEPGTSKTTTTFTPAALEIMNPPTSLSASSPTAMETEEPTLDSSDFQTETKNPTLPCIFCSVKVKSVRKKRVYPIICPSESTRSNIRMYAIGLQDDKVLGDIQLRETIAYHPGCYSTFRNKYLSAIKKREDPKQPGVWHATRDIHKAAFKSISEIIEEKIIEKGKVFFLTDLYATFKSLLIEFGDGVYSKDNVDDGNISTWR